MVYKATILYHSRKKQKYHFYYDYNIDKYHLDYRDEESFQEFLNRVGKILGRCPLSDSIIKDGKKKYKAVCKILQREVGKNGMEKGNAGKAKQPEETNS